VEGDKKEVTLLSFGVHLEKITLAAVFYNEEEKLPGYFRNVSGAFDNIVVVDCSSTDKTAEICRKNGAKVVGSNIRYFENNAAKLIEASPDGWIFILDADERLSPELKQAIRSAVEGNKEGFAAFTVNRREYLFNEFASKGRMDLSPIVRLLRKGKFTIPPEPHSTYVVSGKTGAIQEGMIRHYNLTSFGFFMRKVERYLLDLPSEFKKSGNTSRVNIGERNKGIYSLFGKHGIRRLFLFPPVQTLNYLIRHRFILDGTRGWVYSVGMGIYAFMEEALWWDATEKEKANRTLDWQKEYPES
jgi:glycosyltransferase involved in cell wall biosynthesis